MSRKKRKSNLKIDKKKLAEAMQGLVASMISGEAIGFTTVSIDLAIPDPIYSVIDEVCKATKANPNEVFSKMASDGITNTLQDLIGLPEETTAPSAEQVKPPPALDGDLAKKFAEIQTFTSQLQNVAKMMEGLQSDGTDSSRNIATEILKNIK